MGLRGVEEVAKLLLELFRVSARVVVISGSVSPLRLVIEPPTVVWCLEDDTLVFTELSNVITGIYTIEIGLVKHGKCNNEKDLEMALEHILRKRKLQQTDINEKVHYTKCSIVITNIQDRVKNLLEKHGIKCQETKENILKCCTE